MEFFKKVKLFVGKIKDNVSVAIKDWPKRKGEAWRK